MLDFYQGPFSLPGLGAACSMVAEHLLTGQSVIAHTGAWLDPADAIARIGAGPGMGDLLQTQVIAEGDPAAAVSESLGCDVRMMLLGEPPECSSWQVLIVRGLDELPDAALAAWYRLTERWAKHAQGARSTGASLPPLLLCHRGRSAVPRPVNNVLLAHVALQRELTDLDVRYLVRLRARDATTPEDTWREHVIPPLAGTDVGLVDVLWEACLHDQGVLLDCCKAYAAAQGWTGQEPRDELAGSLCRGGGREPRPHIAHAVVAGEERVLPQRLWRGQAALVLPLVDELRLWTCERLHGMLGAGWALRWAKPLSSEEEALVVEDPLHCQFGHLKSIIQVASLRNDDRRALIRSAPRRG